MTQYSFIADIIRKNWFQEINDTHQREWTFRDDVRALSESQLKDLLFILFECIEIKGGNEVVDDIVKSLSIGKSYKLNDISINQDLLSKFLLCVTISEYRIDALLLHPPEMRLHELQQISQSVGFEEDMVKKIDENWHAHAREKILGK